MSLKDDVAARGVKITDLAKQLGEAGPNLYTALDMEHKGKTTNRKAVLERQQKVREWLASDVAGQARVEEAAAGSEAAQSWYLGKTEKEKVLVAAHHPDWDIDTSECGKVLTLREEETNVRYKIRWRVTDAAGRVWYTVWRRVGPAKDEESYQGMVDRTPEQLGLAS